VYPRRYHSILHVNHEGIDTQLVKPDPTARVKIKEDGLEMGAGDEIVTYVARNLEPYRGFPTFMRSLPAILAARPKAQVLVVGGMTSVTESAHRTPDLPSADARRA